MARRRSYTPEQIITKLREAEIYLGQGKTVKEASKQLEINEQTYYRRRREYWGYGCDASQETERDGKRERPLEGVGG